MALEASGGCCKKGKQFPTRSASSVMRSIPYVGGKMQCVPASEFHTPSPDLIPSRVQGLLSAMDGKNGLHDAKKS